MPASSPQATSNRYLDAAALPLVRTHRVDMGSAYPAACATRLKNSRAVTDRFHVAKRFNEVVDALRKNSPVSTRRS
jgi:transposase